MLLDRVLTPLAYLRHLPVLNLRQTLINQIWGGSGWPSKRTFDWSDENVRIVGGEYDSLYNQAGNLQRIGAYKVIMPGDIESLIFHFHAIKSNNKLFIYHGGHGGVRF